MNYTGNYAKPEWNRDEREYQELNKIEARISSYTRVIRSCMDVSGRRLSNNEWLMSIKGYSAELWAYYKWLKPYIDKSIEINVKSHDGMEKSKFFIEGNLEYSDKLVQDGFKKIPYFKDGIIPNNFSKAVLLLEEVENELKQTKVFLDMGVRINRIESKEEREKRGIKNSMGVY